MTEEEVTRPLGETSEQRVQRRVKTEIDAFEADNQATRQAILDHWWQSQRDLEAEHRAMLRRVNEFGLKIW
jgi:hypothetical protein